MKQPVADDPRRIILGRIKESLARLPTPPAAAAVPRGGLDALAPVPEGAEARERSLAMRLESLGVSFVLCDDRGQVAEGLETLFGRTGWKRVVALRTPALEALLGSFKSPVTWADAQAATDLVGMDAAVVEADAVDAQFGAVFCGQSDGGTAAIALAPHLIVIAPEAAVHAEFASALNELTGRPAKTPAAFTILTGSSQNPHIERQTVSRGHGPQSLTLIVYRE